VRRIVAIVPHALRRAPGQRVRIEAWAPRLEALGWRVDFLPFESEALRSVIYEPRRYLAKAWHLTRCYGRQLRRLLQDPPADLVFLYREASLVGPALLEHLAARRSAPLVYDIDDPVFVAYKSPANRWLSLLKFPGKTNTLLQLANHVVCINDRIAAYALRWNPRVSVVPNCVDTDEYRPATTPPGLPVRVAWIGSHSALPNLRAVVGPLGRLQARHDIYLTLIGPGYADSLGVATEHRTWSAETEVAELQRCHIGIVPVLPHPWNEWKSFFKTVQYMAVGLPVVAACEGSNQEIIRDGINGFLVRTEDEWYDRLSILCGDARLRSRMGNAARQTVVDRFSLGVQIPRVAALFEAMLSSTRRNA
jgi:glycosyltransferase involved in cell wall biosynthesis